MEVITENPIVYIGANDTYDAEIFLYANDETNPKKDEKITELKGATVRAKKEPTTLEKENAKKKGLTWDSVNKVYVKAQELGIVDALLSKLGITPRTTTPPVGVDPTLDPSGSASAEDKGMSTTTKILIGVGALAVVGLIIYSSSSKTPKGK